MLDKMEKLHHRYSEVEKMISDPAVISDQKRYKELMMEYSNLKDIDDAYLEYKKMIEELADAREMIAEESDPEMKEMAKEEIKELESSVESMEARIKLLLVPKDPLDGKNIIMEIRAGTGGDEAALFAADLYRMYSRYSESKGWKIEVMSSSEIELGGFKEIVFSINGKGVYGDLRYESGGHRVQRIPITESGGRIQTSAATVAVLPEAEETDIEIKNEDLKIDVFRSSGPGGQSVNTTDSAVRITHLPTGLVVSQQDEKSQIKNKAKALRVLRSRLLEMEEQKKNAERAADRKSQVGSGDRSERIRTYNFPQGRCTDHRINLTLYKLDTIMQGNIGEIIDALKMSAQEEALQKGE
ncbi:peptide chain release factor 1 [Spirochaeta isovalerica]|uniref:Peptide chain release factor 1 n=1 Tax=Spirochaeta isovalerica TaxID=150 RepID=A0A841REK1_9SPIO|nr:peptide chain release factor 1 [Spirochaeta isovalerica]MBB6481637.1 peptide chain release factor 1 [Spirochaeta isovalerica]